MRFSGRRLCELALYGKILFGEQYFQDLELDQSEMLAEAVKVISSLNYQIRKMLSNKQLNTTNRIIAMKWPMQWRKLHKSDREITIVRAKDDQLVLYSLLRKNRPRSVFYIRFNKSFLTDSNGFVIFAGKLLISKYLSSALSFSFFKVPLTLCTSKIILTK